MDYLRCKAIFMWVRRTVEEDWYGEGTRQGPSRVFTIQARDKMILIAIDIDFCSTQWTY